MKEEGEDEGEGSTGKRRGPREKREKRSTENGKCKKRHKIKNVLEFKFALAPVSIPLLPHPPAPGSSCLPKPEL